jgi:hypothetical protein
LDREKENSEQYLIARIRNSDWWEVERRGSEENEGH